ncbi:MAG: undecaprenyldiphospho-muramoylpentapeptide beta-N-acetylglucosaminyltransferase [Cytophagaceae bacterium]|jgi:UDP-N-acetylglucosamine--N-acetylmuramyl-(pentapeptide) pyrophosphoryl-undecaprenol N-acetylglucosamine transferase|nr:undecaprenyldiphospho-muramoylpentapeptide beta-N-acetylglucosaminyltransferase [Cytophagaceae bacterium]
MQNKIGYKIIISGGGTGGHIFPAVAIANQIMSTYPDSEILFVGAEGRMEMHRVPEAGYKIIGLPIVGIQRKSILKNLIVPFKIWKSIYLAKKIIKEFKPDVAIGVGGYASWPLLYSASSLGVPTVIQEQNSYAGVANKNLSKKAELICVAYDGMEKFFPKQKIKLTGNPVRSAITATLPDKKNAAATFGLSDSKPTILVIGGSLGARTINEAIAQDIPFWKEKGVQLLWQTGKGYYASYRHLHQDGIIVCEFIQNMDQAYAIADIIISRAGALSIAELSIVAKPMILVPSPNVAEDHQTKNAQALVSKKAAIMVRDVDAATNLTTSAWELLQDKNKQALLVNELKALGKPDATATIVEHIMDLIKKK